MKALDAQWTMLNLMMKHGLVQQGWTARITHGGDRILGKCCHGTKTLMLGRKFCERGTIEAVRDVILHEIAHALCGPGEGHGPRWRAKCAEIGAVPARIHDAAYWKRVEETKQGA